MPIGKQPGGGGNRQSAVTPTAGSKLEISKYPTMGHIDGSGPTQFVSMPGMPTSDGSSEAGNAGQAGGAQPAPHEPGTADGAPTAGYVHRCVKHSGGQK